uniref:NADH-ubiquinone oxidoreductase chain 5 n=1 Tax=Placopecten magellanicus TaxID=6577 RepID=Q4FE13_PLAMG|nr:NADH dehydrogenase subunit 5 [Placopecten magellanicus]AAZ06452.1 NADH dehydrogenase subunit 5 [Placopecten magellanicus]
MMLVSMSGCLVMVGYYAQYWGCYALFICWVWGNFLGSGYAAFWWNILPFGVCDFSIELVVDSLGLGFAGIVFLVSGCVFKFSLVYMASSPFFARFHSLMGCFVVSMVLFIFIPNFFGLMLGWDGLGIFSFFLVSFFPSKGSLSGGLVTALTNRVGDSFLVLLVVFYGMEWGMGSWVGEGLGISGFLLALGGMTKSAQYPFCSWLTRAMAAPTPVSSLVHSSTLVTAGVFLLVRYGSGLSSGVMGMLQWSALLTLFVAGVSACMEYDLKKVVALSTLSQVSIMMLAASAGFPGLALFHLLAHAVTKALLFICVGLILMGYSQDIRRLSSCFSGDPGVKWYLVGSCISLCGLPFFSGFYSKELVLESLFTKELSGIGIGLFCVGAVCTSYYSLRLVYFCFWRSSKPCDAGGSMAFITSDFSFNKSTVYSASNSVDILSEKGGGGSGLLPIHSFCAPLFFTMVGLGGCGCWLMTLSWVSYPFSFFKLFYLCLPYVGGWWVWAEEVLLAATSGVGWWNSLRQYESGEFSRGLELSSSFFRELGFLEGLSSQPYALGLLEWVELLERTLEFGWLEYAGPAGLKLWLTSFLECNEKMNSRWYNLYIVVYVTVITFWVVVGGIPCP